MDKSELWLMRDNFHKIGRRQNKPRIKIACKPPIFIKTDLNQINISLLY